jgi:hypothetical protein
MAFLGHVLSFASIEKMLGEYFELSKYCHFHFTAHFILARGTKPGKIQISAVQSIFESYLNLF